MQLFFPIIDLKKSYPDMSLKYFLYNSYRNYWDNFVFQKLSRKLAPHRPKLKPINQVTQF